MPLECDHIRNEFSALLDNELNPEDRELVEEHLSECSECLRELHGYKVVSDAYRFHHPVKAPDDFEARFHAAIAPISRHRSIAWQRWGIALAAGFTVFGGVALWQARSQMERAAMPELAQSMATDRAATAQSAPDAEPPQALAFSAPESTETSNAMMDRVAPVGERSHEPEVALKSSRSKLESEPSTARDGIAGGAGGFGGGGEGVGSLIQESLPASPAHDEKARSSMDDADREIALNSDVGRTSENLESPAPPASAPDSVAPAVETEGEEKADRPLAKAMASEPPKYEETSPERLALSTMAVPQSFLWRELTFTLTDGIWQQAGHGNEAITPVAIPSSAWNTLLDQYPDLTKLCDRDEPVLVKLADTWYQFTRTPPAPR